MSLDDNASYVPTMQYLKLPRVFSGPNLMTPSSSPGSPQNDSETVIVDNNRFGKRWHQFAEGDFIPEGFFDRANLDGFTRRFNARQWTYELRREAQFVFPFLALGPVSALRDRDSIRERGFTLLLGIRNTRSALAKLVSGEKTAAELGIQADTVDVLDGQELISAFPRAIRRINDHLAGMDCNSETPFQTGNSNKDLVNSNTNSSAGPEPNRRKVLVFCESGNDRSAAVVVAYIMAMLNNDAMTATRLVQENRYCVTFDEPMRHLLLSFDSILKAKRDVEYTRRRASFMGGPTLEVPSMSPVVAKKRSFADRREEEAIADCDDMEIDDEDDLVDERKPLAPFEDRIPA